MMYPDIALDVLSDNGQYNPEKIIRAICIVMTSNRDVVELLEAKGVRHEQIQALCSLAE
jgi:hypothetical protein